MRGATVAMLCIGPATLNAKSLRVCADPNNLPFSNRAEQGFENKIADLIAHDLNATVQYTWWAQHRGFARNTVKADHCDLWMGVVKGLQQLDTTVAYYRSDYVFVSRAERQLDIHSFDDPRLRDLIVGVQMIGNDASNTPPAHALARRGIVDNVRGFMVYGHYDEANPAAEILNAVSQRKIDVAIVWGPLAGYFARKSSTHLHLEAVQPQSDGVEWPMAFDISIGVRKDDPALKHEIEGALMRRSAAIEHVLDRFGVPRVATPDAATTNSRLVAGKP